MHLFKIIFGVLVLIGLAHPAPLALPVRGSFVGRGQKSGGGSGGNAQQQQVRTWLDGIRAEFEKCVSYLLVEKSQAQFFYCLMSSSRHDPLTRVYVLLQHRARRLWARSSPLSYSCRTLSINMPFSSPVELIGQQPASCAQDSLTLPTRTTGDGPTLS